MLFRDYYLSESLNEAQDYGDLFFQFTGLRKKNGEPVYSDYPKTNDFLTKNKNSFFPESGEDFESFIKRTNFSEKDAKKFFETVFYSDVLDAVKSGVTEKIIAALDLWLYFGLKNLNQKLAKEVLKFAKENTLAKYDSHKENDYLTGFAACAKLFGL